MIEISHYDTLQETLPELGFERYSETEWFNPSNEVFVRSHKKIITVYHGSGALYLHESIDCDEALDEVLRCIEKSTPVPALRARQTLAGLTKPLFFIENRGAELCLSRTFHPWPETAKDTSSLYEWRLLNSRLNIPVRGKARLDLGKGAVLGVRTNDLGKHYVIHPATINKEYLISDKSLREVMSYTKPHKDAPDIPPPDRKTKESKNKPALKKPRTKKSIPETSPAMQYLKSRFGKGWTARKIKAELKEIIALGFWPTKKKELFEAIVSHYGDSIIEILSKPSPSEVAFDGLNIYERKAVEKIMKSYDTRVVGSVLRKLELPFPPGNTNDPHFWLHATISIIKEVGQKGMEDIFLTVFMEREDRRKQQTSPPTPAPKVIGPKINISSREPPLEYALNVTHDRVKKIKKLNSNIDYRVSKLDDSETTRALKLFIQALYRFAGSALTPTGTGRRAFLDGIAKSEYMRVDTRSGPVSSFSADDFLEEFLSEFGKNKANLPFYVRKVKTHVNKGRQKEKITFIIKVKGADVDLKLELDVNPVDLNTLTKHNMFLTKAQLARAFLLEQKKQPRGFNLTISAIEKQAFTIN